MAFLYRMFFLSYKCQTWNNDVFYFTPFRWQLYYTAKSKIYIAKRIVFGRRRGGGHSHAAALVRFFPYYHIMF